MPKHRLLIALALFTLVLSACTGLQPVTAPTTDVVETEENTGHTTYDLDEILPFDPNVRTGVLDNGVTYFIRANTEPENRADLWLAINAGSILEDEDQLGLAHFLEHMMFNGTEQFPAMGVVDFLESIGMEFGPDVNAYTSFDETVYTIQVPTDDAEILDKGLQVLEEWAAYATLDPEEIEQERGVIVEEWRLRQQTADGRIREQTLPAVLGESRYSDRRPIGDMDVVRNAPPEAFSRFYENWYRPDLMAVIAVGDFEDVDQVEEMIVARFGTITAPESAPERDVYDISTHETTQYAVITDPEETTTQLQIWRKRPAAPLNTGADYREILVRNLYSSILDERFGDIERQPDAPFLSVDTGSGAYIRPTEVDIVFAQVEEDKIEMGLDAVMTELERVRRHGVTESELGRAKDDLLQFYERSYNERNNRNSSGYADEYLEYFLKGDASPGIEIEYELVQQLVDGISLADVNGVGEELTSEDNRVVVLIAPDKEELELPDEAALAGVVDGVMAKTIDPLEEAVIEGELIEIVPEPVAIVSERLLDEVGVTEIELENGVRVLLKPTDFKDDEVIFTGFSLGGSSLVSEEDFPEAATIVNVVTESGVGQFSQSDLEKLLSGKSVSVTPYIRELTEGLEGSSSVEDLDTLFQLIYLYATAPNADQDAFDVFQNVKRAELENRALDPNAALRDAIFDGLYGETIRRGDLPLEAIDSLDLDRAFEIYQERFADMDDFVFAFVGSFDPEEIKTLSQTYLGNLPATDREENWQDVLSDLPSEIVDNSVFKGEGEQSIVQIIFNSPYEPSTENAIRLEAMGSVLDILVREELREELGGVYASGVSTWSNELPEANAFAALFFASDPARVDELIDAAFAQIADLQENGPSAENLEKAKAIAGSAIEENLEQNSFWLSSIKDAEIYDSQTIEDALAMDAAIEALTAEDIQSAAQEYVDLERYVKVALFPEAFEAAAGE